MQIGDRIKRLMQEKNFNNSTLAKRIGVSRPTIGNWIDGSSQPLGTNLNALAKALGVDGNYIMNGSKASTGQQVDFWDSNTILNDDEFEVPFYKDFMVSCGDGTFGEAMEAETRKLRVSKATARNLGVDMGSAAAMTASGNSMSPKINDGDTVFIDRSKTKVKDGKIFAVCHGGVFRFKVLYQEPFGAVRLVSINADEYAENKLTAEQIQQQEFQILGQVWSISSLEPL